MRKTYTSKVPNSFYVISLHRIISHVRDEKVGNEEATRALIAPSGPRTVNVQLAGRLTDCNIGHRQTCPITITTKVFCQTEIGSNEKRKRETLFSLCSVKINGWNCCDLIWWFFYYLAKARPAELFHNAWLAALVAESRSESTTIIMKTLMRWFRVWRNDVKMSSNSLRG